MPILWRYLQCSCLLIGLFLASYALPAALRLSTNPLYRDAGLTVHSEHGPVAGIPIIDPNDGVSTQSLGHLSAEQWLRGRVPWWNPYAGVGLPLAAEMQSVSFFLPFVLLLHFTKGVIYLRLILQFLAGLATIALLRKLSLSWSSALVGGVLYAFSGTFAWFAHGIMQPLAFLPVFLLGIEEARQRALERRRGGFIFISLGLAYSVLAGFPEVAFIGGVLVLLWALLRLFQTPGTARWQFFSKVVLGGSAGLLLTTPLVIPFLEYLQHSAVSHNTFANAGLPASSFLQLLVPYSYGSINGYATSDRVIELLVNWGNIGGYLGITLVVLAMAGVFSDGKERLLKLLLILWAALLVARSVNLPGTNTLFRLIPGMEYIAIYRNSLGSAELCLAILAAFAIDAWRVGELKSRLNLSLCWVAAGSLLAVGVVCGMPLLKTLYGENHGFIGWPVVSLIWSAMVLAILYWLLQRPWTSRRSVVVCGLLVAECVGFYTIPLLSGLRKISTDLAPIAFLRTHLGDRRAFALGTIHPNYGSFFEVPFINHESLPVSDSWTRFIQTSLDPKSDFVTFSGDVPSSPDHEHNLRTRQEAYESAGVRYVVLAAGTDPFGNWEPVPHIPGGNQPIYLGPDKTISGTLPNTQISSAASQVSVSVGTDGGKATGVLHVEICNGGDCRTGSRSLVGAHDNGPLPIELDRLLPIGPQAGFRYRLTQSDATHPVAIWMWPPVQSTASATAPSGEVLHLIPDVRFGLGSGQPLPPKVFEDSDFAIFEFPHPADYFSVTDKACRLSPHSQEEITVECLRPARLVRRELNYPGWEAMLDNVNHPLQNSGIFQALDLPVGRSQIRFRYRPTHSLLIGLLLTSGLALLLAGRRLEYVSRRASAQVKTSTTLVTN